MKEKVKNCPFCGEEAELKPGMEIPPTLEEALEQEPSGKRLSGSKCYESIREYWATEPGICRVVDGCSDRVDRLKALGNGQVMACTAFIGQQIMELERIK